MRSRIVRWNKLLLFVLPVLILLVLLFRLTDYPRRLSASKDLVSSWNLIEAESALSSLVASYPRKPEARRLYATTLLKRGELGKARNEFIELLHQDSSRQSEDKVSLATAYFFLGELHSSDSILQHIIITAKQNTDSVMIGRCLHLLGRIAFNRGEYHRAAEFQQHSLHHAQNAGDRGAEADALRQLGVLAWYKGQGETADKQFYTPALALYRALGDRIGEATTLSNLAFVRDGTTLQIEAFAIRREIGDQVGLADSYYFISPDISDERLTALAYAYRSKSLELSTHIGYAWGRDVAARAVTEILFAGFNEHTGEVPLHDSTLVTSAEGRVHDLIWKAVQHARRDEWHTATALQREAIRLCDSIDYPSAKGHVLANHVLSLMKLKDFDKAEQAALTLHRMHYDRQASGRLLARVYMHKGEMLKAIPLLKENIRFLEAQYLTHMRGSGPDVLLKVGSLMLKRHHLYSLLVYAESVGASLDSLFITLDRYRSLVYSLGGLSLQDSALAGGESDPWLWYARFLRRLLDAPPDECRRLVTEFKARIQTAAETNALLAQAADLLRSPVGIPLRALQSSLEARYVFLEYFVGEENVLVVAVRHRNAGIVRLTLPSHRLNTAAKLFHETILRGAHNPADSLWKSSATFLYRELLSPLHQQGFLRTGDHLILSVSGILHIVPFAALWNSAEARFVAEMYDLSYTPSASQWARAREKQDTFSRILAVAPDRRTLPYAGREVSNIPFAAFEGHTQLLDASATAERVLREIPRHALIHIAAHGKMVDGSPLNSYIQLAERKLELHEILPQKLNAGLVILSACETGLGTGMAGGLSRGHAVVSFPVAFLTAGAASVISPMWLVQDEATSGLMTAFYSHFVRLSAGHPVRGVSVATALAEAQREHLRVAKTSATGRTHPFFWAGFYLIGRRD